MRGERGDDALHGERVFVLLFRVAEQLVALAEVGFGGGPATSGAGKHARSDLAVGLANECFGARAHHAVYGICPAVDVALGKPGQWHTHVV